MSEKIRYGIDTSQVPTRLFIDLPHDVVIPNPATREGLNSSRQRLVAQQLIEVVEGDDSSRLLLNARKLGAKRQHKHRSTRDVVEYLATLAASIDPAHHDQALQVYMGVSPLGTTGRYGMSAKVRWPDVPDQELAAATTRQMRETATDLRHFPSATARLLPELVYADVSRQHGVTLQTNPMGSCSLDTAGDRYRADEPAFEVHAHNIYSHEQQLICFAGLVAIAHPEGQTLPRPV